ncbi:MAG: hypothetical protein WCO60_10805 [Verrucomicrobiota bacterium]
MKLPFPRITTALLALTSLAWIHAEDALPKTLLAKRGKLLATEDFFKTPPPRWCVTRANFSITASIGLAAKNPRQRQSNSP